MNRLSVIIPSRSIANLVPCIEAVRRHETDPDLRIIVVDDFPGEGLNLREGDGAAVLKASGGDASRLQIVPDIQPAQRLPFVYARNCNTGILAAGRDDVILLNDDALLETAGGFTAMQRAAVENPQYGLISAATNLAGNPAQMRRPGVGLRLCPRMPGHSCPVAAFVCVLIPRWTIDMVGLLDERFTAYGWEDNDYCRRVHWVSRRIGIFDGCFVDHSKLKSTFRGSAFAPGGIEAGKQIYLQKWGTL